MGESLETRLAFLQRQLHALNLAIVQAKARNDQVGIDNLRAMYIRIAAQVEELKREAYAKDMPSDFMLGLAGVGDQVVAVGRSIGQGVVSAGTLIRYVPFIALALIVVIGLAYASKIRSDLK